MNPAPNLVFIGPMGAGKTSIGRRVAEALRLRFVDLDQCLEAQTGVSVNLIFELEGEPGFRRREHELLQEACRGHDQLIATGGGAVLDPANRRLLAGSGYVVYLRASVEQQLRRLQRDRSRPLLQGDDRRQRLAALAQQRGPLYEEIADLAFDAPGDNVANSAKQLLQLLTQRWQRAAASSAA